MVNSSINLDEQLLKLAQRAPERWRVDGCGVTRSDKAIPALVHNDAYVPDTHRTRVLLVGGLSGSFEDVSRSLEAIESYLDCGDGLAKKIALSAVPCGNPDGLAAGISRSNAAGGNPETGYPPTDDGYYGHEHDPETRYLWRWISFNAPDVVLEVRNGISVRWEYSGSVSRIGTSLNAYPLAEEGSLLNALAEGEPNKLAPIPGLLLTCPEDSLKTALAKLWAILSQESALGSSPARQVLDARRSRTPLEVARILGAVYGHKLNPVIYTQGVSLSGRLRLKELDPEGEDPVPDLVHTVHGYSSCTLDQVFGEVKGGSNLAGMVWADELTAATGEKRYAEQLVEIADLYRPSELGNVPPPSDPEYRPEDMFYAGAILGRATELTGDESYTDIQIRFLLDAGTQQDNGLFWHDRTAPYFWGRGNGFAALGYCETLTYMSRSHIERGTIRRTHQRHLEALQKYQSPSGGWLEVIDFPGSYAELTVTCMVGYAMARGMRVGWLDNSFKLSLAWAWQFVNERVDDEGGLVDVCTGTGVQPGLREVFDRPAIFGIDDRGGAMALWFACEMERYLRELD